MGRDSLLGSPQPSSPTDTQARRFVFTLGGKPIITFYTKKGTNGWTLFGASDPDPEGAHLSSAFLEGKLRMHVTDPKAKNPHVFGKTITPEYLAKQLVPRYKRIIKPYRSTRKAWTMTASLRRQVSRILPRVEGDTVYVPLEGYRAELRLNFSNRKRWKKTRIRDLIGSDEPLAFVREEGRDYHVRPISESHMLRMSSGSIDSFVNAWAGFLGYSEYLDYVADRLVPEVKRRARGIE